MVDSTSTNNVQEDIVMHEDRPKSPAEIWWSNVLAVVKLRQKRTTMVSKLPRSPFRHMLEYQIPRLSYRYSDHCGEVPKNRHQVIHFPAIERLSYDNYLAAVNMNDKSPVHQK